MANDGNKKVIEEFRANEFRGGASTHPQLGEFESRTTRKISVVILERIG